jgi:hypothetical protein
MMCVGANDATFLLLVITKAGVTGQAAGAVPLAAHPNTQCAGTIPFAAVM